MTNNEILIFKYNQINKIREKQHLPNEKQQATFTTH